MTVAAIITTLVVVILQIITLSLLKDTRKKLQELAEHKPVNPSHNDRDRRDRDFRSNNKRPVQDNRQRQQQTPTTTTSTTAAASDPVEKSLRDINLKLKNAERDQEFARKKMQDNFSRDPNRRRDNSRGGNSGNRDHRHNDRRGNWQDRNRRDGNSSMPQNVAESRPSEIKEENVSTPVVEQLPIQDVSTPTVTPVTASAELTPSDFGSDENMQHGRKFASKRRFSSDESQAEGSSNPENSSNSEPMQESAQERQESENSLEKNADSEIKFGRR